MPTYDYRCGEGHAFEVIHGIHDPGPPACPTCGSTTIRKALSPPTFHFKGSGWAKKERRAEPGPVKAGSEAKAAGEAQAGSEAKAAGATDAGEPPATSPSSKPDATSPKADPPAVGTSAD